MFRARLARPPPRPVVLKLSQERVFMGEKHQGAPGAAMEGQGRTGNIREKTKTTCRVLTALTLVRLKTWDGMVGNTHGIYNNREHKLGRQSRGRREKAREHEGRPAKTRQTTVDQAKEGQGRPAKTREGSQRTDQSKVGSPEEDAKSRSVAKIRRPQSHRK